MTSQSNHDTTTHEEHAHGHRVVSWQIQLGVLAALLFFTFSTVLFYNLEAWVETAFEIALPGWINIVGAMSIATIKALLVCMFFMGLRYDKALNTFALLFCLFCVGLFLGITMIDLDTRDRVYEWKKGDVVLGGTGKALDNPSIDARFDSSPAPKINTAGLSIVEFRRKEGLDKKGSEHAFWSYYYAGHAEHQHSADINNFFGKLGYAHHLELPTANYAAPRTGLTPGLFDAANPTNTHDTEATDHKPAPTDNGH